MLLMKLVEKTTVLEVLGHQDKFISCDTDTHI